MHFSKQKRKVLELIVIQARNYQARHMKYPISVTKKDSISLTFLLVKCSKATAYSNCLSPIQIIWETGG